MENMASDVLAAGHHNGDGVICPGKEEAWLNLTLGGFDKPPEAAAAATSSGLLKEFSCNFCMKKFFSSQALGGHQNAHKRERGGSRRPQDSQRTAVPAMMAPGGLSSNPFQRSLRVHPHAMVHKPRHRDDWGVGTVARFGGSGAGAWAAPLFHDEATESFLWSGILGARPQSRRSSEIEQLDLSLRL